MATKSKSKAFRFRVHGSRGAVYETTTYAEAQRLAGKHGVIERIGKKNHSEAMEQAYGEWLERRGKEGYNIEEEYGGWDEEDPEEEEENPRTKKRNPMTSGSENAKYLHSISPQLKNKILTSIAKHYGESVQAIEGEVTDPGAEDLYEYIGDRALQMQVYRDWQRRWVTSMSKKNPQLVKTRAPRKISRDKVYSPEGRNTHFFGVPLPPDTEGKYNNDLDRWELWEKKYTGHPYSPVEEELIGHTIGQPNGEQMRSLVYIAAANYAEGKPVGENAQSMMERRHAWEKKNPSSHAWYYVTDPVGSGKELAFYAESQDDADSRGEVVDFDLYEDGDHIEDLEENPCVGLHFHGDEFEQVTQMAKELGAGGKQSNPKWIQAVDKEIEEKGTEGAFTAQARKAGYTDTMDFARKVMKGWKSGKKVYNKRTGKTQTISLRTMRRANFAINVQKRNPKVAGDALIGYQYQVYNANNGLDCETTTRREAEKEVRRLGKGAHAVDSLNGERFLWGDRLWDMDDHPYPHLAHRTYMSVYRDTKGKAIRARTGIRARTRNPNTPSGFSRQLRELPEGKTLQLKGKRVRRLDADHWSVNGVRYKLANATVELSG